jgi:hypothetical protein
LPLNAPESDWLAAALVGVLRARLALLNKVNAETLVQHSGIASTSYFVSYNDEKSLILLLTYNYNSYYTAHKLSATNLERLPGMADPYEIAGSAYSSDKVIDILHGYLKADNAMSLEETSRSILELLPTKASLSTEVFGFGEDFFEVAESSSYRESTHLKLANLLETLGESGYFSSVDSKVRFSSLSYIVTMN